MKSTLIVIAIPLIVLATALRLQDEDGVARGGSIVSQNEPLPAGRRLYLDHCARCHGDDGSGNGLEARRFKTPPTDFTAGQYKFRSTPSGMPPLPEDVFRTLAEGLRGTGMLPQLHLSPDQRWAVTRYLLTLLPPQLQNTTLEPVALPEPPAVTPEMIGLGRTLYADAGCVRCHGTDGRGRDATVEELRDYKDRPITPTDLTLIPRKRAHTPEDLFRILVTGINGTPMPSYAGVLPDEQLWALVYYVDNLAVDPMSTAAINGMGMGMMGMGRMGMMRNMPRMMGFVGEESIAMMVDMPAARAWMMGRHMAGARP